MSGQLEGKIYKLFVEGHEDQFYIGATIQSLSDRLAGHRSQSLINPDRKVYKYLNQYDKSIWTIELIEEYLCDTMDELHKQEGSHIKSKNPPLNSNRSSITYQEWIDYKRDYSRDYSRENGCKYYENNKEQFKIYYQKNKEKIKEKYGVKINCECGKMTTKGGIARHKRTAFHINYINRVCKDVIDDIIDKLI